MFVLFETLHYFRLLEINKKFFFGLAKRFPGKKTSFSIVYICTLMDRDTFQPCPKHSKNEFELDIIVYDNYSQLLNKDYVIVK